mmetsp:Transcript_19270/g.55283  ORF Transcript_19270/g.55283 Transcript_19270/m.55283 type:complete len:122 (+) Transcript_19270:74-439(+)
MASTPSMPPNSGDAPPQQLGLEETEQSVPEESLPGQLERLPNASRKSTRRGSNSTSMLAAAQIAKAAFKRPSTWVLVFGWSLALCAGIVNSVAYGALGHFVSHATGATTSVALGLHGYHKA